MRSSRRPARLLVGLCCAALLAFAPRGARGDEPTRRWFTLTTPHFFVHYYKSIRHDESKVAQQVARVAERAHRRLTPLLRHRPSSRTHIVVTDDTDGANGWAQIVPYNLVWVFVTRPGSRSALGDYDHWLTTLFTHEYTHVLHIDTIHGVPRLINAVLGKIWAPNQLQPRWITEGMAVLQESRRTSGGRNRSAIYDMMLRMNVLEGRVLSIGQISSATRYYPRGVVPYLYGSRFIKYIADRFGQRALTRISHLYGSRPVPYALNRVAKQVLGKSFKRLYREFRAYLGRRYALQVAAVRRRGLTRSVAVTTHGWAVGAPRLSHDGRELAYYARDGRSHGQLRIADARSGRTKKRYLALGGNSVAFSPDGRHLVYGKSVKWRTFNSFHDLYVRRRADDHERRLTRGLRARDPDVSPDGRQVVFVTNELGNNDLRLIPFAGGKARVLLKGRRGDQFHRPRWSPDGRWIAVSQWRAGGRRDIVLLEPSSGRKRRLTDDRAQDMDPTFSGDGKRVYFASDRTGIFNIYCHEIASGRLRQVTNVLSGAFEPAVTPDERQLYFVGYSSRGYDLKRMPLRRRAFLPALPFVDQRPPAEPPPAERARYPVSRYSPLRTLYPRSWSLSIGNDAFGTVLGIGISGADAINRHSWRVNTNVSLAEGHVSYGLAYSYRRFWPTFTLSHSRFVGLRGGLVVDGERRNYREENYAAGARADLPVLRIPDHAVTISVGYNFNYFRDADDNQPLVLPGQLSPRLPDVGMLSGFSINATYRNVERYEQSISNERGRQISVGVRYDDHVFGSDYRSAVVNWSWTEYIDNPWLDDHVLALRYGGGLARGDFKRRGFFFVGGFPEQDLIGALIDLAPLGGAFLRGYPPGSVYGDQFHLLNAEYRMPLWEIERGLGMLPLYFNVLHLTAFVDAGNAMFGEFDFELLKVGVGGEMLLEFVIGYHVPLTLRVGYARGLMEGGDDEFFVLLGNPF